LAIARSEEEQPIFIQSRTVFSPYQGPV
jgi:hypothetical protein